MSESNIKSSKGIYSRHQASAAGAAAAAGVREATLMPMLLHVPAMELQMCSRGMCGVSACLTWAISKMALGEISPAPA